MPCAHGENPLTVHTEHHFAHDNSHSCSRWWRHDIAIDATVSARIISLPLQAIHYPLYFTYFPLESLWKYYVTKVDVSQIALWTLYIFYSYLHFYICRHIFFCSITYWLKFAHAFFVLLALCVWDFMRHAPITPHVVCSCYVPFHIIVHTVLSTMLETLDVNGIQLWPGWIGPYLGGLIVFSTLIYPGALCSMDFHTPSYNITSFITSSLHDYVTSTISL